MKAYLEASGSRGKNARRGDKEQYTATVKRLRTMDRFWRPSRTVAAGSRLAETVVYRYCGHWCSAASRHVNFGGFRYPLSRILCN
jgi:hypothetical protein